MYRTRQGNPPRNYKRNPDLGGNAGSGGAYCSWVSVKGITVLNERKMPECKGGCLFVYGRADRRVRSMCDRQFLQRFGKYRGRYSSLWCNAALMTFLTTVVIGSFLLCSFHFHLVESCVMIKKKNNFSSDCWHTRFSSVTLTQIIGSMFGDKMAKVGSNSTPAQEVYEAIATEPGVKGDPGNSFRSRTQFLLQHWGGFLKIVLGR